METRIRNLERKIMFALKLENVEPIIEILKQSGYIVVEGKEAVENMIKSAENFSHERLCSGYRVFPGGDKCQGCSDCNRDGGKL